MRSNDNIEFYMMLLGIIFTNNQSCGWLWLIGVVLGIMGFTKALYRGHNE